MLVWETCCLRCFPGSAEGYPVSNTQGSWKWTCCALISSLQHSSPLLWWPPRERSCPAGGRLCQKGIQSQRPPRHRGEPRGQAEGPHLLWCHGTSPGPSISQPIPGISSVGVKEGGRWGIWVPFGRS